VWKDTRKLATASAAAAIALSKGKKPKTTGTVPNKGKKLAAYIIPPVSITKANYKQLFNGYLKKSNVCRGEFKKYC
jgi:ABC-type xylose transport system substrate-binding protein